MALAFTACQEGNITLEAPVISDEMFFNVLAPGLQTKVADNAFEASDVIGLYVTDYADENIPMPLQVSGNRANNQTVTYDGISWVPDRTIWWGNGKSDVYAYYPYIDNIMDVEDQYFEVAADQTSEGYELSDLLWAKANGVKQSDGTVSLQMNHIMSKLTVKIIAGEDYVGSLPTDASVQIHSTVLGARVDFAKGTVSKDPYSSVQSIKMKKLGIGTSGGVESVVYEAIVVPQMLETSVPLIEVNSKSVSYLLEDSFNFRPGVAYTYNVTLNTSTTAIKVEIDCELEDWNSAGGNSGDMGDEGSGDNDDDSLSKYTDLSSEGTANCYLVSQPGEYRFKAVQGNSDATVGNVKDVEVLWESFGTDVTPEVGDIITSVSYHSGYVCFSVPDTFSNGNALVAVRNSKGVILWSWHIWCAEEGWKEQEYYNGAGIMMDRNIGATSATPGNIGALGLIYQWGRKDPFLGSSSLVNSIDAASTGTWTTVSGEDKNIDDMENNPMTFYTYPYPLTIDAWQAEKTVYDPCPVGWRVPDGGDNGVWASALGFSYDTDNSYDNTNRGTNLSGVLGDYPIIWYPSAGCREGSFGNLRMGVTGEYWSCSKSGDWVFYLDVGGLNLRPSYKDNFTHYGRSVRCQKEGN